MVASGLVSVFEEVEPFFSVAGTFPLPAGFTGSFLETLTLAAASTKSLLDATGGPSFDAFLFASTYSKNVILVICFQLVGSKQVISTTYYN